MRFPFLPLAAAGLALAATTAVGADRPSGYLQAGELDVTRVLEPAPRPGDPRYEADRRIFRATRRLAGSPRWQLAVNDARTGTAALFGDFSCAVGVALTPENAPRLAVLLARATADTSAQTNLAKEIYARRRPFLIDRGPVCQPERELFDERAGRVSYDYPSGHSTRGWTYALVLASLAPDRAQRILERGRGYADSRFVCGAHNQSAAESGRVSASATMAVVAAKPAYQADLAAARTELAALRASGPAPRDCEAERAALDVAVLPPGKR